MLFYLNVVCYFPLFPVLEPTLIICQGYEKHDKDKLLGWTHSWKGFQIWRDE